MFKQLYQLALTTPLVLTISANSDTGKLTLNVIPTPKKSEKNGPIETALTQKLSLTASPEEFNENFPQCLTEYTESYQSLKAQTEASMAVLEAAKSDQVAKAKNAVSKSAGKTPQNKTTEPKKALPNNPEDTGSVSPNHKVPETESDDEDLNLFT